MSGLPTPKGETWARVGAGAWARLVHLRTVARASAGARARARARARGRG